MRPSLLLTLPSFVAASALGAAEVPVAVGSNFYNPTPITIVAGDSVRFTNQGGLHNAQADDLAWRCAQGCSDAGGNGDASGSAWSFARFFNEPGTFRYHCDVHGGLGGIGMSGMIIVLPVTIFADDFESGDTSVWDTTLP